MAALTAEEEKRKKAIFDAMSARSRRRILEKGYDAWDPFILPKEPLDIRMAERGKMAASLMKKFKESCPDKGGSEAYRRGAWEMCMGIIGGDDRWKGIYDFACWYRDFLNGGRG